MTIRYRKFGSTGWDVSVLGLGVMNLMSDKDETNESASSKIIRYAIDNGVNYIYAGYSPEDGRQENILKNLGKVLGNEYRDKVKISLTVPSVLIASSEDFYKVLSNQLEWLDSGKVDFCLLGGIDRYTWPRMKDIKVTDRIEKAIGDGLFDKTGFFFHDYFQALREVIDGYDNWSLCGFQYSYMDVDHHPGYGGIKYAYDKRLAVVATEPHLGGRLTAAPPETVDDIWKSGNQQYTRIEWALRWVWHHEEIASAISNISSLEQLKENIKLAESAEPNVLKIGEKVFISGVRDAYRKLKPINCTTCRACMPCPEGIDVPRIFEIYNEAMMFDDMNRAKKILYEEGHHPEKCTNCGSCIAACGRQIPIPEWLKNVNEQLSD